MTAFGREGEAVLNHLLFHKSLSEGPEESRKLDRYLEMVQQMSSGTYLATEDPFERSVALAFQLVIEQGFNPWDINLVEFAKRYLAQVRRLQTLNLIVAGKLVYMAWEILRRQSTSAVQRAEELRHVETFFADWQPDGFDAFIEPVEIGAGGPLLRGEVLPIEEMVRRQAGTRPVTLLELIDAFDEAKREAEIAAELVKLRERYGPPPFDDQAHKENLEEEIANVWARIVRIGQGPIAIGDLNENGRRDGHVAVFVSILYLARMGRIRLWQESLPFGEIFVEALATQDVVRLEDAKAEALSGGAPVVATK